MKVRPQVHLPFTAKIMATPIGLHKLITLLKNGRFDLIYAVVGGV